MISSAEASNSNPGFRIKEVLNATVIVAALGYFVDIYDLVLFSIVRVNSLKSMGVGESDLMDKGVFLLNMQMAGMLIGGILWGIWGDKRGRLSVLFGSIILYSFANIANGFVHSVFSYSIWRFIAGVGLAGELGAGITLVSEVLSKENRGYGTMIVASIGISGAILANIIAKNYEWRTAYFFGGGLGLILLILRVSVYESGMFNRLKAINTERGNFLSLFSGRKIFLKYLNCILIGVPIWYVIGILITFSPEFAKALHVTNIEKINPGDAIMFSYMGLVAGDFLSGWFSQIISSRKKSTFIFLVLTTIFTGIYFFQDGVSHIFFYSLCGLLGFATGYWAVFVTIAAEQFGTNIRSTVTTTVPNFVRGSVIPVTLLFQLCKSLFGILWGGALVGIICLSIALFSLYKLEETFGKDLDFLEGHT